MSWRPRRRTARTSNFARKVASIAKRAVDREHANWEVLFNQQCGESSLIEMGVNEIPCTSVQVALYGQGATVDKAKFIRSRGGFWVRDAEVFANLAPMRVRMAAFKWQRNIAAGTNPPTWDLFDNQDFSEGPWLTGVHEKLLWTRQWTEMARMQDVSFEWTGSIRSGQQACAEADLIDVAVSDGWRIHSNCFPQAFLEEARPVYFPLSRLIPRGLTIKESETLVAQIQVKHVNPTSVGPSFQYWGDIVAKIAK